MYVAMKKRHALQNEDAFVNELMEQWEARQQQFSSDDKKELANAKKRLLELDALIQGLYENQIKGIMPERQIQRLMSQYDQEQITLEDRINELENSINSETPKKPDARKTIAERIKELICEVNGIKYVNLPGNLPETEIISMIRKAFAESRIYLKSDPIEDLERIKESYIRWRQA